MYFRWISRVQHQSSALGRQVEPVDLLTTALDIG
jgi:hypothetical protein